MEPDAVLLEAIVLALVTYPEEVKIDRSSDDMGILLTLSVHKDDMGKVIGRSGSMAKAMRTVLRGVGMRHNARVNLKVTEPEGSTFAAVDSGEVAAEPRG